MKKDYSVLCLGYNFLIKEMLNETVSNKLKLNMPIRASDERRRNGETDVQEQFLTGSSSRLGLADNSAWLSGWD